MNINVVTGYGQRTGTSFVMQKAKEAGLPINGEMFLDGLTINKHNPNGYWDINPFSFSFLLESNKLNNSVCKIWPSVLEYLDHGRINNVVVLKRKNKQQQLESMAKVLKDELTLPINKLFYSSETVEFLLEDSSNKLTKWLENKNNNSVLEVYTEDLNIRINDIISFLGRGLKCH
jgi:hypothetical protein